MMRLINKLGTGFTIVVILAIASAFVGLLFLVISFIGTYILAFITDIPLPEFDVSNFLKSFPIIFPIVLVLFVSYELGNDNKDEKPLKEMIDVKFNFTVEGITLKDASELFDDFFINAEYNDASKNVSGGFRPVQEEKEIEQKE